MRLTHLISRLSIRQQVLLTVLLPLLLLTLALSGYTITSRIHDARQTQTTESEILMDFLRSASEFALLTHNAEALERLSKGPLKRPEVSRVLFYGARLQPLYQSHAISLDIGRLTSQVQFDNGRQRIELTGLSDTWAMIQPVVLSGVSVDDFDPSRAPDRHIGWVVLLLNDQVLQQRQRQILIWGLAISVVGLLLALALAFRISRNISRPIIALSHSLERYQQGDYQVRTPESHQQEIGALQRGVNRLIDQVQHHQQQLQSEVDRATVDLQTALTELEQSNQKLQQSKDQLELSALAKDQFLARMSHELRTPISSVLGFTQLLKKSPLDENQLEYCRIIHSASQLLLRVIDDILDFSKCQSDNLELEQIAFNPEQCIEDVVEMQAAAAAEKGLRLELASDAPWPLNLLGDPTRFSQLISNLVANAIKFTEHGGVKIQLSSRQVHHRTQLLIEVEDSGIGIHPDQLPNLFEPFSQADPSINRRFGGSGLGLVICKRLAELMDGEVSLTSVPGEGTRFQISLWLDNGPVLPAVRLPELKVLLCCVDARCRERFAQQLGQWGCQVESLDDRQQLLPHLVEDQADYDRVLVSLTREELKTLSWHQFLNPVRQCFAGELVLITEPSREAADLDVEWLSNQLAPVRLVRQPVGRHRLLQALQKPSLPAEPQLNPEPLQGLSILLAEDNRFNRELICRMLQAHGAMVEAVENGSDAVVRLEHTSFDVIIMDLHMPILNGWDACQQIRQLPSAAAHTPILVQTADVISDQETILGPLKLQGILYKPVDEMQLVKQVLSAVKRDDALQSADVMMRLQRFGIPPEELKHALDEQFEALQQALLQVDRPALRDHAHQLSGIAAMAGLSQLDDEVLAFRQTVKQGSISDAWQCYRKMKDIFD